MYKLIVFVLINVILLNQAFSQKKATIHITGHLVKKIAFKDTASKSQKEMFLKCKANKAMTYFYT